MKRILSLVLVVVMIAAMFVGCGKKTESWKVTCPWAPSGVASMVSQKAAAKSPEYSESINLVAEAIKGDAATVNTWIANTKGGDPELVFVGEGLLSITEILDPAKMQFGYEDFVFVENLYSSVFVLSADATLNIKSIADLEAYVKAGNPVSVAVNGATGSEAFLAAALFGSMGAGDQLKLTPYQSAAEAAKKVGGKIIGVDVDQKAIIDGGYYQNYTCSFFSEHIGKPMDIKLENQNWCGAGKMLSIDAAGNFYPCTRFASYSLRSKKPIIIGNVRDGINKNLLRPFLTLDRLTQSPRECIDCEVASGCAWCQGENYDAAKTHTVFERATAICKMHKARVRANNYYWNKLYRKLELEGKREEFEQNKKQSNDIIC